MKAKKYSSEFLFKATHSRGPGGQNVNKVSSAAFLKWNIRESVILNEEERQILLLKLASHINKEGEFYLKTDEFRDLERNKALCIEKLDALMTEAFHKPRPRRATKPTRGSKVRRQESKSQRAEVKQTRQKVKW